MPEKYPDGSNGSVLMQSYRGSRSKNHTSFVSVTADRSILLSQYKKRTISISPAGDLSLQEGFTAYPPSTSQVFLTDAVGITFTGSYSYLSRAQRRCPNMNGFILNNLHSSSLIVVREITARRYIGINPRIDLPQSTRQIYKYIVSNVYYATTASNQTTLSRSPFPQSSNVTYP